MLDGIFLVRRSLFFLVAYVALFSTEKHYRLSRETSDDNNTSSTCRRCFSTLSIWKEMCIIDSRGVINPLTLILIRHFMHICFLSSKTPEQLFSNLTEIWERIHLKWSSQLVLVAFEPTWLIVHRRWSTLPFANCMLLDDSLKSQVKKRCSRLSLILGFSLYRSLCSVKCDHWSIFSWIYRPLRCFLLFVSYFFHFFQLLLYVDLLFAL